LYRYSNVRRSLGPLGLFFRLDLSHNDYYYDVDRCPVDADAVAEAYLLGTSPRERGTAFEEHYIGCAGSGRKYNATASVR
jgi:hypothetical protein